LEVLRMDAIEPDLNCIFHVSVPSCLLIERQVTPQAEKRSSPWSLSVSHCGLIPLGSIPAKGGFSGTDSDGAGHLVNPSLTAHLRFAKYCEFHEAPGSTEIASFDEKHQKPQIDSSRASSLAACRHSLAVSLKIGDVSLHFFQGLSAFLANPHRRWAAPQSDALTVLS